MGGGGGNGSGGGGNGSDSVELATNYKVIGAGACGVVYEGVLNGERIALKVVNGRDEGALAELSHEVKIYEHLKDVQGKIIPHLLWNGGFSFHGQDCRGIATSLCIPDATYTKKEKKDTLEVLYQNGVDHGDVRKANFVRSPVGKLFLIDFGRSEILS